MHELSGEWIYFTNIYKGNTPLAVLPYFLCQLLPVKQISQIKQDLLKTEGVEECLLCAKVMVDVAPDETTDDHTYLKKENEDIIHSVALRKTKDLPFLSGKAFPK